MEAVNACPRVFLKANPPLGSSFDKGAWGRRASRSSAGGEGQKTFSLQSSPPQAHTVNLFPKHSVDKFYRRLGK